MHMPPPAPVMRFVVAIVLLLGVSLAGHAQPIASIADASGAEGSNITFTITLSAPSSEQVTVRVNTTSGTATGDVDYNQINSFLDVVFTAGTTMQPVSVPSFQDLISEGSETFDMNILQATNATVGDALGVGTIVDDEPPPPVVNVADASAAEGSALVFDVTLSFASDDEITVRVNTTSGTATGDVDYNQINSFNDLVYPPGTTLRQVMVPSFQDSASEGNEYFNLNVLQATNAVLGDGIGQGTIVDDEPPPPTVSVSDTSTPEGDAAVFTVTLSFPTDQEVTVRVNTTSGTATGDVDYNQINSFNDLIFPPMTTQRELNVPTFEDTQFEGNETFDVNVLQVTNATVADGLGIGTIIDDDPPPPTVTVSDTSTTEGGNAVFDVTLSFPWDQQVTVRVNTTSGTATGDVDYNQISSFNDLIFPPGTTLQQLLVPTFQDAELEGNETFDVNVLQVTNATVADGLGVGTIVDDETPPPTVGVADVSAGEGDIATFSVTLSSPTNQEVTVRVSTTSGTATGDVDYDQITPFIDLVFPAMTTVQQVNVQTFEDGDVEGDEFFTLNIVQATNAVVTDGAAQGTIVDDDTVQIPTASEWGLIALIAALGGLGCLFVVRNGMA